MAKVKTQVLQECVRFARTKNTEFHHPEYYNFPHYSFLIWKGKILTWATNKNSGCSHIQFGYSHISKTHAEFEVMRKAWVDLNESCIVNIRLNKLSETKMSAPCKACKAFMKRNGIKEVYYSTESDNFEKLEL